MEYSPNIGDVSPGRGGIELRGGKFITMSCYVEGVGNIFFSKSEKAKLKYSYSDAKVPGSDYSKLK